MRNRLATATVLACTTAIPAAAMAASISFTVPVTRSGLAFTGDIPVAVPQFDPGLGTLTGETLTMTGLFTPGESWVINSGPPLSGTVPVTLGAKVGTIVGQLISLPTETVLAAPAAPGQGDYAAFGTVEPFTVSGTVPAIDLLAYQPDVWAETIPLSPLPGYFATAELGTLNASLIVAYTYAPHPQGVPEPPAWALLSLGLIAMAGAVIWTGKPSRIAASSRSLPRLAVELIQRYDGGAHIGP